MPDKAFFEFELASGAGRALLPPGIDPTTPARRAVFRHGA